MKVLQRVIFPQKHLFMPQYTVSKKHQRSSTEQEEGITNEGGHHMLLLHKIIVRP